MYSITVLLAKYAFYIFYAFYTPFVKMIEGIGEIGPIYCGGPNGQMTSLIISL
jgi:hypothetical protein